MPDLPLYGIFGDRIMDHYRNPRNLDPVRDPDVEVEEFNPFCGDRVELQLRLDGQGRVDQVGTRSEGCSIIQAAASMMAEVVRGKTLEELAELSHRFYGMMQAKNSAENGLAGIGDLKSLQVVRQYPVRIKCALLPWLALEEGLKDFRSRTA